MARLRTWQAQRSGPAAPAAGTGEGWFHPTSLRVNGNPTTQHYLRLLYSWETEGCSTDV